MVQIDRERDSQEMDQEEFQRLAHHSECLEYIIVSEHPSFPEGEEKLMANKT